MKKERLRQIIRKSIVPAFDGWSYDDLMIYCTPLNSVLRGVVFSTPIHDWGCVKIGVFARPLYVRSQGLIGSYYRDVKRSPFTLLEHWTDSEFEGEFQRVIGRIRRCAGGLSLVNDPDGFARNCRRVFPRPLTVVEDMYRGLSFAKAGYYPAAERCLKNVIHPRARNPLEKLLYPAPRVPMIEETDRARQALDLLQAPDRLQPQLALWERETIAQFRQAGVKVVG